MSNAKLYKSGELHGASHANEYSQTHQLAHRFLAYRDFNKLLGGKHKRIKKVLDFGSGTGASTWHLFEQGYDVIGLDRSDAMVEKAKQNFPMLDFLRYENLQSLNSFDLVFSSFVLFELSSKEEIVTYLDQAAACLKQDGLFFGITGSEHLHKKDKDWMCFNVDYIENLYPKSGDLVKLGLYEPDIEFSDYYWLESDYRDCFKASNLELMTVHYPIGYAKESFSWKEELFLSPFVIFLAKKRSK